MQKTFLEKIKYFFVLYYLPLIFAFFVGLVSVLPSILAPIAIGSEYQGMPFLYQNDEAVYLMRIEEVLDGNFSISSPAYEGFKDTSSLQMPFPEYVYALPAYIFGIFPVIIGSKFLLPALLFFLVYIFIWQLSGNKASQRARNWNAIAGGLIVTLGYDFVDFRHIFSLLIGDQPTLHLYLWTRLVNPITGALFLFSFLLIIWQLIKDYRRIWLLFSGLLLVLMSGYIFSYALALTISVVIAIIAFFQKNYILFRRILVIAIIGIIPIVTQLASALVAGALSTSGTITKNGLFFTHEPLVNKLLVVATFLFVAASFWYYKNGLSVQIIDKSIDWWWFSVAILAALFIVFNQQVITGMTIWPQHFVQYSIPLIYCLGLVFLFNVVRNSVPFLWKGVVVVIVIATVGFGLWSVGTFTAKIDDYRAVQRYAPLLSWFKENAEKNCVVLAAPYIMGLMPSYTSCDAYYSNYSYFGVPQSRVEHGYVSMLRLGGILSSDIDEYFLNHKDELVDVVFGDWSEKYYTNKDPWLNKLLNKKTFDVWFGGEEKRMAFEYRQFMKTDFEEQLKRYKLSYVVIDGQNGQKLPEEMNRFTRQVYQSKEFTIFEVI